MSKRVHTGSDDEEPSYKQTKVIEDLFAAHACLAYQKTLLQAMKKAFQLPIVFTGDLMDNGYVSKVNTLNSNISQYEQLRQRFEERHIEKKDFLQINPVVRIMPETFLRESLAGGSQPVCSWDQSSPRLTIGRFFDLLDAVRSEINLSRVYDWFRGHRETFATAHFQTNFFNSKPEEPSESMIEKITEYLNDPMACFPYLDITKPESLDVNNEKVKQEWGIHFARFLPVWDLVSVIRVYLLNQLVIEILRMYRCYNGAVFIRIRNSIVPPDSDEEEEQKDLKPAQPSWCINDSHVKILLCYLYMEFKKGDMKSVARYLVNMRSGAAILDPKVLKLAARWNTVDRTVFNDDIYCLRDACTIGCNHLCTTLDDDTKLWEFYFDVYEYTNLETCYPLDRYLRDLGLKPEENA